MPRKANKRKAIQAAKRAAQAAVEARKNRKWPGTRRADPIAQNYSQDGLLPVLVAMAVMERMERDD